MFSDPCHVEFYENLYQYIKTMWINGYLTPFSLVLFIQEASPQIRRVRLSKIIINGAVSFDDLVLIAIKITFPDAPAVIEDFEVTFTYYDVDNDCVTIASTDELMDAIEQFSGSQTVLRITTEVKRSKCRPFVLLSPSRASGSLCPDNKSAAKDHPMDSPSPSGNTPVHLNYVVDSIVSVLATAAVALQTHVKAATKNNERSGPTSTGTEYTHQATAEATCSADFNSSTVSDTVDEPKDESERLAKEVVDNITMKEAVEDKKESRPFIHGRHTCDSCLVTPIVGIRYHAINRADYDLCAACKENYKGNEIQFEASELVRDLHFQDRWHHKHDANKSTMGGPRSRCGRPGPQGDPALRDRGTWGQAGRRRGPRGPRGCKWEAPRHAMGMDMALKEAIRRSLHDVSKEQEKYDAQNELKNRMSEEAKSDMPFVQNANVVLFDPVTEKDKKVAPPAPGSDKETANFICDPFVESNEKLANESTVIQVEESTKPSAQSRESSFSSEAAGNGEAAEALGLTLDQCADAIDAMMMEVERDVRHDHDVSSFNSDDKEEDITVVEDSVVDKEELGPTIVDGEDLQDEVNSQGSDDWQEVVNEDAQFANDELIARAAQFLGSALFESEMSQHVDLANSNLSTASSALTSTPTIGSSPTLVEVAPAQLERFAHQLSQLREIGFEDEAQIVEILERFTAANIGSDSEEEVSVNRVVDELLKV